jgi:hypothetical protein
VKVKTPAPTPEDPAIAAARAQEQQRADAAYTLNTQSLLDEDTKKRTRRFGQRVALTGANPGAGGGSSNGAAPTFGGGSYDPASISLGNLNLSQQ